MTSDDEIERRLRALKAGGGTGGAASAGGPASAGGAASGGPGEGDGGDGGGSRAERSPGRTTDGPLEGEVIEPGAGGARPPFRPGPAGTRGAAPPGVGVRVVHLSVNETMAGRLGLWFGIALVVIGAYYVLAAFFPGIRVAGSLGVAIVGALLLGAGLTGRAGGWARTLGAVLVGFGVLPFIAGVAGLGPNGWGSLGAGLALVALALLRLRGGRGLGWQGYLGIFLVLWGGWGAVGNVVPGFPTLGDLIVPGILVLVGINVVRRGVSGPPKR